MGKPKNPGNNKSVKSKRKDAKMKRPQSRCREWTGAHKEDKNGSED